MVRLSFSHRDLRGQGKKSDTDHLARKAELERLVGKPTAYLPTQAFPTNLMREGKKAAGVSKIMGRWIMATNPGISMRRAKTGQAVLDSYLK
jgi:hypothetical protein